MISAGNPNRGRQFEPQIHLRESDVASGPGIDEEYNRRHGSFETWDEGPRYRPANRHSERMVPNTTLHAGTPVSRSELPETLYHVTTNLPGIRESGHLRASNAGEAGGLGGSHKRIVSLTTDPHVARQLEEDVRDFATVAHSRSPEGAMDFYHRKFEEHGLPGWEHVQRMYDVHAETGGSFGGLAAQLASHYHSVRARMGVARHPVIFSDLHNEDSPWWGVHPEHVGTVHVPTSSIPAGALITDFDRGRPHGLEEVRAHADIPVKF